MNYQEIVIKLASEFHESWRMLRLKTREDGSPYFEERWKETGDAEMDAKIITGELFGKQYRLSPETGKPEFDIANLKFENLSEKWQKENFLSAKTCLETASEGLIPLASAVHNKWLERNAYAKDDPERGV